ncbi:Low affinity immunoglobulin epsilon Fc receptor [Aphelenchoides avenae]|nr:Low affinity immunoglobulin epsilon Fc receptor [Aphelenchus avenae]
MFVIGFVLYGLLTASTLASAVNAFFDAETWEGALKACQRWNAALPIIHDIDTDKALRDYTIKYINAEYFHIGLRRNASSGEWQWIDGSNVDYSRWEQALTEASPTCAWAFFGVRSTAGRWRPVECNLWERSYICVAPASGSVPMAHDGTSNAPSANSTASSRPVSEENTEEGVETGKTCEDTVAAWKCKTLKTVYACKASNYISYAAKNCAKTCGLCS